MDNYGFVIIGGVAAGMSAASRIRRLDQAARISVFEKTGFVSYIACGMPYFIAGKVKSARELIAYDTHFFKQERNIDVYLHSDVIKILPSQKTFTVKDISTGSEKICYYDRLLISTGARAVIPPIKGADLKGIFTLRIFQDGVDILDYINFIHPQRALIIGAGSVGMEVAEAFSEKGVSVTIVEKMPNILGSMDEEICEVVENELKNAGVTLIKSTAVVEFTGDDTGVKSAILDNNQAIKTDIVIIGIGVKPNSELAAGAGVELGQTGAVKVNERMETNIPGIYAAGDCAEANHLILNRNVYMPLGTTANKQGRVAGENMAGGEATFPGVVGTSVFKVFGLEVGRTGLSAKNAEREDKEYIANTIEQTSRAHYYPGATQIRVKLVAEKNTGSLLGAQLTGREGVAKRLDVFATAISARMTVRDLTRLDLSYAPPFAPVYDPVLIAANELSKKLEK